MASNIPSNEALRRRNGVLDQRQQQIDPAGKKRVDLNKEVARRSQKQPGQDLRNPQDDHDDDN